MFIEDLRKDFYERLIGKRILVIVNYDIDAICASKILQTLFKYDNMLYSIVPVMGISGMKRAYNEHKGDVKFVLLVNCGGCADVIDLLQPEEDVLFFICDSHRPYHVCNVYSDNQVLILGEINPEEAIPDFDAIFQDSEDEEDDDDDEEEDDDENDGDDDSEPAPKRSNRIERIEQRLLKQRKRREWEQTRTRLLFEYTQFGYYGRSSAVILFELAWRLSKDSLDLLWWAIVGLTEQMLLGKVELTAYTLETGKVHSHVARLTNRANDRQQEMQTSVKIRVEEDLNLALFRHWSVIDSMKYSVYTACRMKLWTYRGEKVMHELLVDMGLPLVQAGQTFNAMDLVLRKEFLEKVQSYAAKYNLAEIAYNSFVLSYGYRNRFSAADYVYALLAILESVRSKERTPETCFLEALDSLSRNRKDLLEGGIECCKTLLVAVFKQVQSSLEAHAVYSAGPFLYFVLQEENPFFSCPHGLLLLARFLLRGHVAVSRNRRAQELPLIAVAPVDASRGYSLLLGIAPVCETGSKNFLGKAFEQAALRSGSTISQDFFEPALIQIRHADCTKFLDALTVLLS